MSIAYATKRTLVIPALLPHIGSATHTKFRGRAGTNFKDANNIAIEDGKAVMNINSTEFPSWSEILDYEFITDFTGVHVMDVWDFMRTEFGGALLNYTTDIDEMPPITSWMEFVDEFNTHFDNKTMALIGSAFALMDIDQAFKLFDEDAFEKIRIASLCFLPSEKVLDLIRAAVIHVPKHYVGVHIRFGDMYHLSQCDENNAAEEYGKLISSIRGANITKNSAIYLGSKDRNAKRCFDEHSQFEFRVFSLDDITNPLPLEKKFGVYNISADIPSLADAMDAISLDVGTKYLLIDLMLVSLGHSYFFSRVSFRPKSSTFQEIIEQRHKFREQYMGLILNNSSDHHHLRKYGDVRY
jgi:hypothetical protein